MEEEEEASCGLLEVKWTCGFPADGRVAFADDSTLCYASGGFLKFAPYRGAGGDAEPRHDATAGGREWHLQGPGAGLAAPTVSAPQGLVAFADREPLDPTVHVFTHPGGARTARLRGAARLEVVALALSDAGPYLAAWSGPPELSLSLWDWRQERPLCRFDRGDRDDGTLLLAVADVAAVSFAPGSWQQLCTVGDDHVCVWSVERSDTVYRLTPRRARLPAEDGDRPGAASAAPARPVSHCWGSDGDLYVGCAGGQLLRVEVDAGGRGELATRLVARLGPGRAAATAAGPDAALYAGGADGVLRRVAPARDQEAAVAECWAGERPVFGLAFSPDRRALAVATAGGRVHVYRPPDPTSGPTPASIAAVAVDEGGSAPFVAAAVAAPDGAVCVSARRDGAVQLWAAESGRLLGGLALGEAPRALACPASSRCAALGTSSGRLFVVDARDPARPRIVSRERLTRAPLDLLRCDEGGRLLVAAASSEGRAFVADARPSRRFAVLGFVEEGGEAAAAGGRAVVDASVRSAGSGDDARLLLLLGPAGGERGTRLVLFHLPGALGPDAANPRGDLSEEATRPRRHELAFPAAAVALGRDGRSLFVYCALSRLVKEFSVADAGDGWLAEERRVAGHDMPDARLVLAAGGRRLYSASSDGLVRAWAPAAAGARRGDARAACHCPALGGVCAMAVSDDGRTAVTVGRRDGALVCLAWRGTGGEEGDEEEGAAGSRDCADEDAHLASMAEDDVKTTAEKETDDGSGGRGGDGADGRAWAERREAAADRRALAEHEGTRRELRDRVAEARRELRRLSAENDAAPERERLPRGDFVTDEGALERLRAEGERAVDELRESDRREKEALAERRDAVKRRCWDAMAVKGRCLRAFLSGLEVWNFPVRERRADELRELERAKLVREVELADARIRLELLGPSGTGGGDGGRRPGREEDGENGGGTEDEEDIVGTLSEELGVSYPYLYRQLELHSREQRVIQTLLLRDVTRRLRLAFNATFDSARQQKEQEAARVRDAEARLADLLADLAAIGGAEAAAAAAAPIVDLTPTADEQPELALLAEDAEMTAERRAGAEDRGRDGERETAREGGAAAVRSRALLDMMGGELETRRDGAAALRPPPPPPPFAGRPESEWSEEERRQARDFERRTRELAEERERLRKTLEAEAAKTRAAALDGCRAFDERLARLAERRALVEAALHQEELRLAVLAAALLQQEELEQLRRELLRRMRENAARRADSERELPEARARADALREAYDDLCAEDKLLERAFRKKLGKTAQGPAAADALARLYKRRPWARKLRAHTDAADPGEPPGDDVADEADDAPENAPDGVDLPEWERFCEARRTKARSELAVRRKAAAAAEAAAFARTVAAEGEELRAEAEGLAAELEEARAEATRQELDGALLVLLRRGQVEVDAGAAGPDYSDARLVPRVVVESPNATIRALCEEKIAGMESGRETRRAIARLQWKQRKLRLEADGLRDRLRLIQTARVSRELLASAAAGGGGGEARAARLAATAERNLAARDKAHERKVRELERRLRALADDAAKRRRETARLKADLPELRAKASEVMRASRAAAAGAAAAAAEAARARHERVARRRRLADEARERARDIAALREELHRMRMRSFPALAPSDH